MSAEDVEGHARPKRDEEPRRRLQIDFSQDAYDRLVELRRKSGTDVRTNTEVVRNALRVLEWYLQVKGEGYKVQLAKDNTVKEVELIF